MIYMDDVIFSSETECLQMLDMLVVGGGYVGLSVAVAVKQSAPHLAVEVVEAAPEHVWEKDERASAVIAAATRMLQVLNVWDEILPEAQPINSMIVTDSRTSDPVRPVFLTFDGEVEEGMPFSHMIPNVAMVRALSAGALLYAGSRVRGGPRPTMTMWRNAAIVGSMAIPPPMAMPKSRPEEKALPSPCRMTTRTEASAAA